MSNYSLKGSESANEWAKKRKDQIESSKRMREERKTGSVFKNVGEQQVLKTPHQQQNATSTSGFSSKSVPYTNGNSGGGTQMASTSSSIGFNNYQKYHQESQQIMNNQYSQYGGLNNAGPGNKLQSNGFGGNQRNQQNNFSTNNITYDENFRNELPIKTQENYFIPQKRDNIVTQSIQYDSQEPQNYTNFNGFKGIQNNSSSQQQQQQQFRSTNRKDSYSRQDLEVARSNLKLLKNKMTTKSGRDRAQSYANTESGFNNNQNNNNDDDNSTGASIRKSNRGQSQYNNIPRPGGRPASGLSNNIEAEQQQYQNNNYRKAFVPRQDSSENLAQINDILLNGGGINLPKQQQQMARPKAVEYDPSDRSQKQPVRRINQNQVLEQHPSDIPQQQKSYQQSRKAPQEQEQYSYKKGPAAYQEEPEEYEQPKQKSSYNDIYENVQDDGGQYDASDERTECPTCGRKFNLEALQKHTKICKKVFVQKRKVFDIKKQRALEDEDSNKNDYGYKPPQKSKAQQQQQSKKPVQQDEKPLTSKQLKAAKWKADSERFRAAMRAARGDQPESGGKGGNGGYGGGNAAAQYEPEDDRVECKFCGRKFADLTAQRHIPVCEKKYKESQIKNKGKPNAINRTTAIGFKK